jgi:hypothetical protein
MGKAPYGRPYRRRKAVAFSPGLICSLCGEPIRTRGEFVLHHDQPVSAGGNAFSERPAHKSYNATHGGRLGAQRSGRRIVAGEGLEADRRERVRR